MIDSHDLVPASVVSRLPELRGRRKLNVVDRLNLAFLLLETLCPVSVDRNDAVIGGILQGFYPVTVGKDVTVSGYEPKTVIGYTSEAVVSRDPDMYSIPRVVRMRLSEALEPMRDCKLVLCFNTEKGPVFVPIYTDEKLGDVVFDLCAVMQNLGYGITPRSAILASEKLGLPSSTMIEG